MSNRKMPLQVGPAWKSRRGKFNHWILHYKEILSNSTVNYDDSKSNRVPDKQINDSSYRSNTVRDRNQVVTERNSSNDGQRRLAWSGSTLNRWGRREVYPALARGPTLHSQSASRGRGPWRVSDHDASASWTPPALLFLRLQMQTR